MAVAETRYEHIVLNDNGVPIIAGTTMKVIELVLDQERMVGVRRSYTFSIRTYPLVK